MDREEKLMNKNTTYIAFMFLGFILLVLFIIAIVLIAFNSNKKCEDDTCCEDVSILDSKIDEVSGKDINTKTELDYIKNLEENKTHTNKETEESCNTLEETDGKHVK
jgi:hypothetical protein